MNLSGKKRKVFLYLQIICSFLFMQVLTASGKGSGNLVDVNWLEKNLKNSNLLILDASPAKLYNTQHIPGAINVDMFIYGIREVTLAEMEKMFQSWGVSPGKKIVIYDQGGTMMATRLFYSFYYYGFPVKDIFLLDGGLSKWQEAKFPITKEVKPPPKGTFKIKKTNEEIRVRLPEFLTASGDPENNVLLEALGANWHFGEVLAFNKPGHIPNAILLPSNDFYNTDKTFKSAEEIKKILDFLGIKPGQKIYSHCGGGVSASVPFFALKFILNYPNVKLYIESELGWLHDERDLPYWTYDAPYLMRESSWLQFWGGKMLRTYGGANISMIDIRPENDFYQNHIPFSINIPIDIFNNHLTKLEKLPEILGPAGLNPAHEAVIVSGGGLTKEAALAYLILEKLGQNKISILIDSLGKWARMGFAVTKDTTIIGNKSPLAIQPAVYQVNLNKNVIIGDPKTTKGIFPKVFMASGKNLPAKSYDGKVVNISSEELLSADGKPKAAKDIWNILTKAGITRYAELICVSDDPAEAAVNYFILKLMGFPDIKVLL